MQWSVRAMGIAAGLIISGAGAVLAQHHQVTQAAHREVMLETGRDLYRSLCETCHGPAGDGAGGAPNLVDGQVVSQYPTTKALAGFIQKRMPASDPRSLTSIQARQLALWIRHLNHLSDSSPVQLKLIP